VDVLRCSQTEMYVAVPELVVMEWLADAVKDAPLDDDDDELMQNVGMSL